MAEYPVVCETCGTHWPDDHFELEGTRLVVCARCLTPPEGTANGSQGSGQS